MPSIFHGLYEHFLLQLRSAGNSEFDVSTAIFRTWLPRYASYESQVTYSAVLTHFFRHFTERHPRCLLEDSAYVYEPPKYFAIEY